jgi:heptosyltransferase-3
VYSMNIFIHHNGALGDTLLSLPALCALRTDGVSLHLAGRADVVDFLKRTKVVDEAISSDRAIFAGLYAEPSDALLTYLKEFGRAYVFAASDKLSPAATISSIIGDTRTVRTIPPADSSLHAGAYRLLQLDHNLPIDEPPFHLFFPREDVWAAQCLLADAGVSAENKPIAVHPGSGAMAKCWPLKRYFELIERLQDHFDRPIILFSGMAESPAVKQSIDYFVQARAGIVYLHEPKLIIAASLLSCCAFYIGNDSGFTHLAAVAGCAAVALFGPTDPARWKPVGGRVTTIRAEGSQNMNDLTVQTVFDEILQSR